MIRLESSSTFSAAYAISETGLVAKNGWTPELWEAAGHEIARYQKGLMWLIGDWLNAGDREGYVERGRHAEACERFGIAYDTAAQASRVAAAFESCTRVQDLSWKHHQTVANHPQAVELLEWAVEAGATVRDLRERVRKITAADSPPLPAGVYGVIYADPPWEYGNKRLTGSAVSHYPTMPVSEICELPIRGLSAADSVLFLWATAPCLPEAMQVISSWGFNYKAQFIWDKVRGFNGNYNDVRHELLLIATRGSCVPKVNTLDPSVIAERRTEHSRKPELFYELIERMYPLGDGTHVELFARRPRNGWASWGNELADAAGVASGEMAAKEER